MKKLLFIYTDWNANEERRKNKGYGGVSYYRIFKPAHALRKLGYQVTIVGEDLKNFGKTADRIWPNVFTNFDAVVVKQMDNPQAAGPMFFYAGAYGKPVILDLDDDYLNVKPDMPGYVHYHPGSDKRAIFAASLSLVDAVFVSTQPLKDSYSKFLMDVYKQDTPIYVLPNGNQAGDWPALVPKKERDVVKIGYAGSVTHNADLRMVLPALLQVLKKFPQVELEIMGALNNVAFEDLFGGFPENVLERIRLVGGTNSWDGYPQALKDKDWNIGIAPLVDDVFTRGKSHIKWMEYASVGLPCVASPTYPYSEPIDGVPVIEDGKTGFLARSVDEWVMVLSNLVTDASLRREIAANAREAILKNWQYDSWSGKWADSIESVLCNFQTRRTKAESSSLAKTGAALGTQESADRPPS